MPISKSMCRTIERGIRRRDRCRAVVARTCESREVPWWFSEKYRVSISDPTGQEIVSKSKAAILAHGLEYTIPLDPRGAAWY